VTEGTPMGRMPFQDAEFQKNLKTQRYYLPLTSHITCGVKSKD
jgi:hypothetical protein